MSEPEKLEVGPTYAFQIPTMHPKDRWWYFEMSCTTCGHPHLRAGDICPPCKADLDVSLMALGKAFQHHSELLKRGVHIYGVGLVDPWTREGKRYLEDGM